MRARVAAAWPDLIERIAAGEEVRHAIAAVGLKRDAVRSYRALEPDADEQWKAARQDYAQSLFDEVMQIARSRSKDQIEATDKRELLNHLRWSLQKLDPKNYSDKAQLDINVKSMDLTRIIEAANARILARVTPNIAVLAPTRAQAQIEDAELVRSLEDLQ
jgi:hypothetical protein